MIGLLCAARAQALAEFCPAHLDELHALNAPGKDQPATLFSFDIGAAGTRTASGRFVVESDKGWYAVDFANLALHPHHGTHVHGRYRIDRTDYYSGASYVRFPQAIKAIRSWVLFARVSDDAPFTWDQRGTIQCVPDASDVSNDPGLEPDSGPPRPELDQPAPSEGFVAAAHKMLAPAGMTESCAQPFVNAKMQSMVTPAFPTIAKETGLPPSTVLVIVAVDASGKLYDADIWASSGYSSFDNAALDAARRSTYVAGVAYCQPAPGLYLFHVNFTYGG